MKTYDVVRSFLANSTDITPAPTPSTDGRGQAREAAAGHHRMHRSKGAGTDRAAGCGWTVSAEALPRDGEPNCGLPRSGLGT